MVFRCLLLEERSTKICDKETIINSPLFSSRLLPVPTPSNIPLQIYLIVEVIAIACYKDVDVSHDLEDIQTLQDRENSNYCHTYTY